MPSKERIARELQKKDYLIGKTMRWRRFTRLDPEEREPCVFCWEAIRASDPDRNEGFLESESGDWVCFSCLEAFIAAFEWEVEWPEEPLTYDEAGIPIF